MECVGYLLEELRNPETLEQMRKDVEEADIFIGSLIFIQVRCTLTHTHTHAHTHTLGTRARGRAGVTRSDRGVPP